MYSNDCNNSSLRIIFAKTNLGMFRVAKNMVVTIVKFTNLSYAMSGAVLCNWNCFLNFICFLIAMMDAILKIDMNIDGSKNWKTESKMYSTVTCSVEVISSLEKKSRPSTNFHSLHRCSIDYDNSLKSNGKDQYGCKRTKSNYDSNKKHSNTPCIEYLLVVHWFI